MDNKLIEMFVKNQMFLKPSYDGEIITFKGRTIDTSDTVKKLRQSFNPKCGNGDLELVMCYYDTSDLLVWKIEDTIVSLRHILKGYKNKLPVKYRVEEQLNAISDKLYSLSKSNYVCSETEKSKSVVLGNLVLNNYSEELSKEALKHLCGLGDTRFIMQRLQKTYNGNIIDMVPSDFKRVCNIKTEFSSVSNMIRALGYPYSDYHKFISYGILVSVDNEDRIYMVKDDTVYCMSVWKFSQYIDNPREFNTWEREFTSVYNATDLTFMKKARLEFFECMK